MYNEFLSHLRMTLGPELLIGRNANYFYLFGFFQVKIYDCTPWKYFHCNIFFTYIYFTFLYENVCNVFAQFFYMCWINVLLIKHFLVDYLFHLCGDFLFSLGGGDYLPSFKVVCLQNMVGVVYLLIPRTKKVGVFPNIWVDFKT